MTGYLRALLLSLSLLLAALPAAAQVHLDRLPQSLKAPEEVVAVIEIPAGSNVKYEIDKKTGMIFVDRFQSMAVAYPANYGSITSSMAGDGDPLDVIVYTRTALHPGVAIKVRPIGVLKMVDGGETDDKILAVPVSKIDPTYDGVKDIADLPDMERQRLEAFFRVYKDLPAGRKKVELNGFENAEAAKAVIRDALARYSAAAPK